MDNQVEHGLNCGCGVDVQGATRLLDLRALAGHLAVAESTLHVNRSRAAGRTKGAVPSWWRDPDVVIGNAAAWTLESAEAMRQARHV